jgi:hypothetical protein
VLARPRPAAPAAAAAAVAADLLELAVPSLLIWLLCWFALLHCGLSALAEALCFGDRRFSADWCRCGGRCAQGAASRADSQRAHRPP